MRINHNMLAINTHRQMGNVGIAQGKSMEKLSSGFRINRAGDDAAGLAISEKMRAQIRGLSAATKNAQDGVSLIQTAEGGLQEIHSMLNRMVELATNSANGTYKNEVDRENLNKEVQALKSEIDRVAEATNFNGIKLLDGSLGAVEGKKGVVDIKAFNKNTGTNLNVTFNEATKYANTMTATAGTSGTQTMTVSYSTKASDGSTVVRTKDIEFVATAVDSTNAVAMMAAINSDAELKEMFTVTRGTNNSILTFTSNVAGSQAANITAITGSGSAAVTQVLGLDAYNSLAPVTFDSTTVGSTITVDGKEYEQVGVAADMVGKENAFHDFASLQTVLKNNGVDLTSATNDLALTNMRFKFTSATAGKGLELQVGDTSEAIQKINVKVGSMSSTGLSITNVDVSKQQKASDSINAIKNAINTVSSSRGDLGALQNRLEHTISNLEIMNENITASEARIRDVDMAKEMIELTKNNILLQASQAMLAQANQAPQGVLQLLR